MSCNDYIDLICLEMDEEISQEQRITLQTHLKECENCRRFREAIREISMAVAQEEIPPANLARNVMKKIHLLKKSETDKKKKGKILVFRYGAAAVAAALLIVVGLKAGTTPKNALKLAAMTTDSAAGAASSMEAPEAPFSDPILAEETVESVERPEEEAAPLMTFSAAADATNGSVEVPKSSRSKPMPTEEAVEFPEEEVAPLMTISDAEMGPVSNDMPAIAFANSLDGIFDPDENLLLAASDAEEILADVLQISEILYTVEEETLSPEYIVRIWEADELVEYWLWTDGNKLCWVSPDSEPAVSPVSADEFLRLLGIN